MIIENKEELFSKKNGKPYVVFTIGGKKYSSFNAEWNTTFNKGDNVAITTEQKGAFVNLKTLSHSSELSEPVVVNTAVDNGIKSILLNKTLSANSYEFGKAGNRFKLYFEDVSDLLRQMNELKEAGLYDDVDTIHPKDFGKDHE